MSKVNSSRRAFLRGSYLTREGRAKETARQNPLGLSPPWHRDIDLASLCQGCAQPCVDACNPCIIQIHAEDHEYAGTPYLDFKYSGCTFCGDCLETCPQDIGNRDDSAPKIGLATINHGSCIAWNQVICMSCSDRCELKAIHTTYQRRPMVDSNSCNGCGMCVSSCPMNALSVV